ncbi:hypothetical protein RRG08_039595 [Elysia crispata]|uniref:Uncharacterized protein n=1 Tax=Elysia crispata TaxID=231223 RepID=A0AAE1DZZ9_9GAST|nr:hypothetical protein RRG08_039595 [Elysia crispata]
MGVEWETPRRGESIMRHLSLVSASRDLQIKEIKERKELRRKPGGFGRAGVLKNRRNQIKISEGRIRI